jgi:hypothetical protein
MGALTAGASRLLERVLAGAAAGRLAPVIDRTYPLQDAAQAHARIRARKVVGKSLLIIDGRRDDRRHRPPPRSAATWSAQRAFITKAAHPCAPNAARWWPEPGSPDSEEDVIHN